MVAKVGTWAVIVVMPAVQAEFGVGRAEASLPHTLTMIGFAFGNFAVGRAVDRWGVTRVLNSLRVRDCRRLWSGNGDPINPCAIAGAICRGV